MVFAGLLLCFPLEGEAAAILNLGLEELGKRVVGGEDGLCEMRSWKPR